jgi:acid stress-induced BolA-like protein IbaG/YrbA
MLPVTTTALGYEEVADEVKRALRSAFQGNSLIETTPFQADKVEVVVVSAELNGKSPLERQDAIWDVIKSALGDRARRVALVMAYGTDELF